MKKIEIHIINKSSDENHKSKAVLEHRIRRIKSDPDKVSQEIKLKSGIRLSCVPHTVNAI